MKSIGNGAITIVVVNLERIYWPNTHFWIQKAGGRSLAFLLYKHCDPYRFHAGCNLPSLLPVPSLKQSSGLFINGMSYPFIFPNLQLEMDGITINPPLLNLLIRYQNHPCRRTAPPLPCPPVTASLSGDLQLKGRAIIEFRKNVIRQLHD
ncbi:MAG TPA: hypothetical protein VK957_06825 [Lunatimonas sp.]|nr:hypothetical protein [Lunatimonas sp.]